MLVGYVHMLLNMLLSRAVIP